MKFRPAKALMDGANKECLLNALSDLRDADLIRASIRVAGEAPPGTPSRSIRQYGHIPVDPGEVHASSELQV
jgi:hypothetical protein